MERYDVYSNRREQAVRVYKYIPRNLEVSGVGVAMAQLTLQPIGYGNFYGDSYGGAYAYCVGTQQQYDALSDTQTATIKAGYTTVSEAVSAITATNPTEQATIFILDRSTDVSGIPATINGQPITIDYTYADSIIGYTNRYYKVDANTPFLQGVQASFGASKAIPYRPMQTKVWRR